VSLPYEGSQWLLSAGFFALPHEVTVATVQGGKNGSVSSIRTHDKGIKTKYRGHINRFDLA
jgi:hypothetical protein